MSEIIASVRLGGEKNFKAVVVIVLKVEKICGRSTAVDSGQSNKLAELIHSEKSPKNSAQSSFATIQHLKSRREEKVREIGTVYEVNKL